jgi:acyl-CoA thioester hydrolase
MAGVPPAERPDRGDFPVLYDWATRWRDNDCYGHMNNVVHYEYFDSAVNRWLIESGALPWPRGPVVGLVAETGCRYFAEVGFPDAVTIGLRAERIGATSATYALALFGPAGPAAATCRYVHVYVNAATRRPTALPPALRAALERIV